MTTGLGRRVAGAAAAAAVAAGGATVATESQAAAQSLPVRSWQQVFLAVGTCGVSSGDMVKGVQSNLWASHMFSNQNTSNVDGYVGSSTTQAIKNYQTYAGVTSDGCAGYSTLAGMWAQAYYTGNTAFGSTYTYYGYNGYSDTLPWYYDSLSGCWSVNFKGWITAAC